MSWLTDPELFIDKRGSRICHLWRCKVKFGTGSPIYQRDFTLISQVPNHLTLVGNTIQWPKSSFDALMTYLCQTNLIVNCQGFAIVPSYPISTINGLPNENQRSYFWSHDVLNMSRYGLPVPSIPFRATQYLEGGVAPVKSDPNSKEAKDLAACTSERNREKVEKQALEKKVSELQANNSALTNEVKKLKDDTKALTTSRDKETAEKQALAKKVADLEANNSALKNDVKKLKDDTTALISSRDKEKAEKQALTKRVAEAEANNLALKNEVKKLKDDTNALISSRDQEKAEKVTLAKKVADLEAKNSTLDGELKREKDAKNALIKDQEREKTQRQALEKSIADLEAMNSTLKDEVEKGKTDKQALEEKIVDLTAKLDRPWMNHNLVPADHWVPFEELVVKLRRNNPFDITRCGANFSDDNTSNVLPTYFSRAVADGNLDYPIMVVSIEDLTPDKEKARFDPNVWGLLNNSGIFYAFRKQN